MTALFTQRRQWSEAPTAGEFKALFTPDECRRIVSEYGERKINQVLMPYQGRQYRDTDVRWIYPRDETARWVYERLDSAVGEWNSKFDFIIEESENLQLASYRLTQNYDWHTDFSSRGLSRRKISVVTMLSPVEDYRGGLLQFFKREDLFFSFEFNIGDTVVFPSWMKHRVTPVTEGQRWSLSSWYSGPPFR